MIFYAGESFRSILGKNCEGGKRIMVIPQSGKSWFRALNLD
ncbi:hypothetical protein Cabys_2123 [Caldithrix abyssi DSM 13497]|uniref:Uncharacterized protein n=1 Tax=Caldithrix abyssi DSM 13497 TaxID=880073 RepID=A0A1J1CAD4_CALAY|nr:hypothetical protein Cabys_2123 [Caldithrix abyssi DSM 13497]